MKNVAKHDTMYKTDLQTKELSGPKWQCCGGVLSGVLWDA